VVPLGAAMFVGAHLALSVWLGDDFANASTASVRILLVGLVFNALAHIPFAVLQATGRSRLPALAHCGELPVFFVVTYFATKAYGIEGAAASWTLRAAIDWAIMHRLADRRGFEAGVLRTLP
jgi:O-antigen/teichoic acid export membrane protein